MVKTKKAKVSSKKEKALKTPKKAVRKLSPKAKTVKKTVKPVRPKLKKTAINESVLESVAISSGASASEEILKREIGAVKAEKPVVKKEAPSARRKISPHKEILPPKEEAKVVIQPEAKELELRLPITLKDLAVKLQTKPSVLIKMLMDLKIMVGINQVLEGDRAELICRNFGFKIRKALNEEETVLYTHQKNDAPEVLRPRPPVVTFMGHVDHGKTSLLDAIRKTKVAESEHGGITQHIGAYRVILPTGEITFLDTPGHEAFTAMRSRGASITDIVVLVVAADDGVMPQTVEAIDHARAAEVPIIAAINKIDIPQANVERVKKQLSELNLMPEDWGGKTIAVAVSAKTGQGIDELLEMILLEAQMLELKANPDRLAKGVIIEAKISKGKGPVSTLLIQNGTLHLNNNLLVGPYYGKIRAMFDDHAKSVTKAKPSFPVEVLGISGVPLAGEPFFVIEDEKTAKEIALKRQEQERQKQVKTVKRINLEDLHAQIQEGRIKELKLIVKADVQGSLEAIKETLNKLSFEEIKLNIIHEAVGSINASDAILAVASNALILGFNVTADERASKLAAKEGIDIRTYNIIYELINDIKQAIEGMLEPKIKKVFLGRAEVRKVFRLSRFGTVAGCFVVKGKINRAASVTLLRNSQAVFEGKLSSLKRFKDDVREVQEGFECGMSFSGFEDFQDGDLIEAYEIEKIARKL